MFLRMRLVMIGVRGMRIIRRRGLIRLCCMRCSRMSVSRDRRFRRGDREGEGIGWWIEKNSGKGKGKDRRFMQRHAEKEMR